MRAALSRDDESGGSHPGRRGKEGPPEKGEGCGRRERENKYRRAPMPPKVSNENQGFFFGEEKARITVWARAQARLLEREG